MDVQTVETPPVEEATLPDNLKNSDRCDACGAQAYVSALINGSELLFCSHHFIEAEKKLVEIGATIVDERYKLEQKRNAN